jgi:hypothetical protein
MDVPALGADQLSGGVGRLAAAAEAERVPEQRLTAGRLAF